MPEVSAFEVMIFLLVTGAMLLGARAERWRARSAAKVWRKKRGASWRPRVVRPDPGAQHRTGGGGALPAFDSAEQLRCVMSARFAKQPLLSASERRVFFAAERAIAEAGLDWRVMAQVNLGEILRCADERAFAAINSKRVDMLIVTGGGMPVAAIEYQGSGHHQGTAAARDAIKKEALRKAGVAWIEINAGDRSADLEREIARLAAGGERQAVAG